MTEESNLNDRITNLENEIKLLKVQKSDTGNVKKEKKEKKPRAQTEYNKFVSGYINEQKEKLGANFNHKVAFGEAAKKWTEKKNTKSSE